jgi:hypothetical protein
LDSQEDNPKFDGNLLECVTGELNFLSTIICKVIVMKNDPFGLDHFVEKSFFKPDIRMAEYSTHFLQGKISDTII